MPLRVTLLPLLMLTLLPPALLAADMTAPLPVRNLYPPMMRFFDPTPDSALRPYEQQWTLELNQHYSTVNMVNNIAGNNLLVDMELYVIDPVLRHSFGPQLELSLRTPILLPASGLFDHAIQTFHGWFNMPNGGRELRPSNRYGYHVANGSGTAWQGRNRAEFGNMELSARYQFVQHQEWALAGLTAIKLPTASAARGWGSGAADLALGMVASYSTGNWFSHLEGWLIQPLARDQPGIHYRSYPRGSVTTGYRWSKQLSVIVQAQGGNSPYRSFIGELDHPPFLVAFGLRGGIQNDIGWNISVTENISQKTTQDIALSLGFSHLH